MLPNGDLMKSRIRNYRRMSERRVVNKLGVTYDTSHDQLNTWMCSACFESFDSPLIPSTRRNISTAMTILLQRRD